MLVPHAREHGPALDRPRRPLPDGPDDQRFLFIVYSPARGDLVVVENWFEELKATVGND